MGGVNMLRPLGLIVVFFLVTGCIQQSGPEPTTDSGENDIATPPGWLDFELTDVATGEKFRITDFKGKPVLVESFAVWCPICTEQQKQTKELEKRVGDAIVHVSIDTDPNEDEEQVREHVEKNGFDWLYAISPIEMTQGLIDQYGIKVVNAPSVPMVLICPDQSNRFLRSGVKTPEDLIAEVEKGC
jgi:cytochrome oxidase Cu insertion factor (SCO1/SenC/PrrC family)